MTKGDEYMVSRPRYWLTMRQLVLSRLIAGGYDKDLTVKIRATADLEDQWIKEWETTNLPDAAAVERERAISWARSAWNFSRAVDSYRDELNKLQKQATVVYEDVIPQSFLRVGAKCIVDLKESADGVGPYVDCIITHIEDRNHICVAVLHRNGDGYWIRTRQIRSVFVAP